MKTYREMAEFLGKKRFSPEKLIEYYNTVYPRTADKKVQNQALSADTLSRNAKLCMDALESVQGTRFSISLVVSNSTSRTGIINSMAIPAKTECRIL